MTTVWFFEQAILVTKTLSNWYTCVNTCADCISYPNPKTPFVPVPHVYTPPSIYLLIVYHIISRFTCDYCYVLRTTTDFIDNLFKCNFSWCGYHHFITHMSQTSICVISPCPQFSIICFNYLNDLLVIQQIITRNGSSKSRTTRNSFNCFSTKIVEIKQSGWFPRCNILFVTTVNNNITFICQ